MAPAELPTWPEGERGVAVERPVVEPGLEHLVSIQGDILA